jgi:hypothetical protein
MAVHLHRSARRVIRPSSPVREVAHTGRENPPPRGTFDEERVKETETDIGAIMNTIRTALRRLLSDDHDAESTSVHFHRRGDAPEPCFDRGCTIPRLTV